MLTKVAGKEIAKKVATKVVGRFVGRLVPFVGWILLAKDLTWDSKEIRQEQMEKTIKESAVHDEEITMDTQIQNDLGITGDDAVDFMIAYGKAFNVDVSNFMAGDYFSGEGGSLLSTIIGAFTGKKKARKRH